MSLMNRSVTAATWEFGSVITQAVLQLAVMAILARLIPPEEFGLYAIVNTSLSLIALFSEIGVGSAVVQRKELTEEFLSTAFIISITLGLLGSAITWAGSPLIAWFFKRPDVVNMVRVASLTLFITGYSVVATSLLERELLFKDLAIINITSYAIGFGLVGAALAYLRVGAWAIVVATLSQNIIRSIMLMVKTKTKTKRIFSKSNFSDIVRFCAGVSLGKVFNNIASQIDNIIVGRLMGSTSLGIYQMGFQIMDLPRRFLVGVIDRVMYSSFTRVQGDEARMRFAYTKSVELANVILVPIAVIMIIVAPEAVRLFLGNKWTALIVPLQILLIQVPLRASVRMGDITGTAVGKVYTIGILKIIYAVMIAIAAIVGVRWGLVGVTVAVSIMVFINLIMMVTFTLTYVKISVWEYLQTWLPGLAIATIITIVALPSVRFLRLYIESDLIRTVIVLPITALVLFLFVCIYPRIIGKTALQLMIGFGKRLTFLQGFFSMLEKRSAGSSELKFTGIDK